MFGLGFIEIIAIFIVVFLVIKPEDLPKFFKQLGEAYGELKKTVSDVKKIKDDFIEIADKDYKTDNVEEKKKEVSNLSQKESNNVNGKGE